MKYFCSARINEGIPLLKCDAALTITLIVSYKVAQVEVNFPIGRVGVTMGVGKILET
jgi:hypothetical protein